jgi:hypothetical protein
MIQPITTNRRRNALRVSVTLCTVAMLLLPLAASPQSGATATSGPEGAIALPAIPPPLTYPDVTVRHDPFDRPAVALVDADGGVLPAGFVLPPNAGIASPPRVDAVILGTEPKALVEVDGRSVIVSVGTKIEGSSVVGIDSQGIDLENGERLVFASPQP